MDNGSGGFCVGGCGGEDDNKGKTLGIIGSMNAESMVLYYQIINREVNWHLGGNSSANMLIH